MLVHCLIFLSHCVSKGRYKQSLSCCQMVFDVYQWHLNFLTIPFPRRKIYQVDSSFWSFTDYLDYFLRLLNRSKTCYCHAPNFQLAVSLQLRLCEAEKCVGTRTCHHWDRIRQLWPCWDAGSKYIFDQHEHPEGLYYNDLPPSLANFPYLARLDASILPILTIERLFDDRPH